MSSLSANYVTIESKVALRSAILCDDVRREASGKVTLVGCYGGGIRFRRKPSILQAKIYCIFQIIDENIEKFDLQIETPTAFEGQEIRKNEFPNPDKPFEVVIPVNTIVEEAEKLILSYSLGNEEWIKLLEWNLYFRDDAISLTEDESKRLHVMHALKEGRVTQIDTAPSAISDSASISHDIEG